MALPHPARCVRLGFRHPAFPWQRRHRCLSALRYRIAGVLDGVCGLLPGILQGLAGVVYGLARGFDPGGTVFDMQMNVLKLQCVGECIEIAGNAFDVGNGMR